jgi:acetyltransferase EpsM
LKETRRNSEFVIIGAGRMGAETLQIAQELESVKVLGFLDDRAKSGNINGVPILGGREVVPELLKNNPTVKAVVAIGNIVVRKKVVAGYSDLGLSYGNLIHPRAVFPKDTKIGLGCIILAGCVFTVDITVGNHVIVNSCSSVAHDVEIGDYCMINSQVAINGNTRLKEGVYVGSGATIIQGIECGAWSNIGAGAVVIRDVPDETLVVGVPASPIKRNPLLP